MGIRLRSGDRVVGMEIIAGDEDILFATERGYGKRVKAEDFRVAHRGGYGVRTIPTDERNGLVIGLAAVTDHSNVLLIDTAGKMIRLSPQEIRTMGRQAKGVRLIRLEPEQTLAAVVAFEETENGDNNQSDQSSQSFFAKKSEMKAAPEDSLESIFDMIPDGNEQLITSYEDVHEEDDDTIIF
jgi:DNA gyrase subunit A